MVGGVRLVHTQHNDLLQSRRHAEIFPRRTEEVRSRVHSQSPKVWWLCPPVVNPERCYHPTAASCSLCFLPSSRCCSSPVPAAWELLHHAEVFITQSAAQICPPFSPVQAADLKRSTVQTGVSRE